jgi:glutathione S-transferase
LEVEEKIVAISKGQTRGADFPNPLKKVPYLQVRKMALNCAVLSMLTLIAVKSI